LISLLNYFATIDVVVPRPLSTILPLIR